MNLTSILTNIILQLDVPIVNWDWEKYGLVGMVIGAQFVYQFVKDRRSSKDIMTAYQQMLEQSKEHAKNTAELTREMIDTLVETKGALTKLSTLVESLNGKKGSGDATD